jgi:hypothetical protein
VGDDGDIPSERVGNFDAGRSARARFDGRRHPFSIAGRADLKVRTTYGGRKVRAT